MRTSASFPFKPLVIVFIMAAMLAAGCQSTVHETDRKPASNPVHQKAAVPLATFGIIYPMAHPYYETITQNAKEASERYGVHLIVKAPDEADLEQQIRMLETMIAQDVDGIAISPIDSEALEPVINKAMNAGIPVICFESDVPGSKRLSYIGSDNAAAGARMGKMLDEQLNGNGMVIVENGISAAGSSKERLSGMLGYLQAHTQIQVLEVKHNEGSDSTALKLLENMLDDHPHFDAFIALDYVSCTASILAWKAQGLSRYALTIGMMPETKEAIRNGQITTALSQNEQIWGELIVESLYQASIGNVLPLFEDSGMIEMKPADLAAL
ncbi:sugar ABC transporter substrate-binding protein [Paenibacillus sp. PL91]|uniref:sugar ABC transporter substrate-binding protein n=1 Tax=Paenibacillus sp. PL91 TaxID=2729538 RepID=UPI00145E77A9|nr:substrate-binding domain-containing protein [Paenibacillus sp. PL91]MBC9198773.1 substrate-binding domain-containing protein [Paenibacillus sp. PL91]